MSQLRTIYLATLCVVGLAPGRALAQQLPGNMSIEQAVTLLQQNPGLQSVVRQRLQQSGLTRDQIHERLRAAGYPENTLDAYISEGAAPDSSTPAPTVEQVQAIAKLGVDAFPPELTQNADSMLNRIRSDSAARAMLGPTNGAPGHLTLFGMDVLRQGASQFQQVSGPVDDTYRLGPGDQLVLFLTGAVERSDVLDVTTQGFIVIPKVGQIYVNALTLGQLREILYNRLPLFYSGVSRSPNAATKFDLAVAKIRVQTVRVTGEVARPGSYQVAATGGVLTALYDAGGLSDRGNFRSVEVRRGAQLIATVDLYEYLQKGVISNDVRLSPGDVIWVPLKGTRVKVAGEVTRPAIYELKPGETLREAVRLAGGLTPYASTEAVTIDRLLPPSQRPAPGYIRTVLTATLREVEDSTVAPTALFPEDSITVFRATGGRRAAVSIAGSVWQPGTYQLTTGMRLWDVIKGAGGLRPDTYGGRVQVTRTFADSTQKLLGFSLDTVGAARVANNPVLLETDRITIYGQTDFRPSRYVTVYGEVQHPGPVAFADSMTLRDVILMAGGLREEAYLGEAEVSRLSEKRSGNGDSLAVILRVSVDSSYVTDSTGYISRPVGRSSPEVVLHPYDNVFVRRQPGWELQRNVAIGGEVRFPGRYTLTTKDERVSSVIARAGGLTSNAYPRGFQLIRHSGSAGPIAIDLPRVIQDPRYKDNLVLAAGDSLFVPTFLPTVRVEGSVNLPSSVTYVPNASLDYYISAAGGFNAQADKGRIFVKQPNGLVQHAGKPEPGATVSVPKRDPAERRWLVEMIPFFTALVQVGAAAATLIVALHN